MTGRIRKPEGEKQQAVTFGMPKAEVDEMRQAARKAGERRGEYVRNAVRDRMSAERMGNR